MLLEGILSKNVIYVNIYHLDKELGFCPQLTQEIIGALSLVCSGNFDGSQLCIVFRQGVWPNRVTRGIFIIGGLNG